MNSLRRLHPQRIFTASSNPLVAFLGFLFSQPARNSDGIHPRAASLDRRYARDKNREYPVRRNEWSGTAPICSWCRCIWELVVEIVNSKCCAWKHNTINRYTEIITNVVRISHWANGSHPTPFIIYINLKPLNIPQLQLWVSFLHFRLLIHQIHHFHTQLLVSPVPLGLIQLQNRHAFLIVCQLFLDLFFLEFCVR